MADVVYVPRRFREQRCLELGHVIPPGEPRCSICLRPVTDIYLDKYRDALEDK